MDNENKPKEKISILKKFWNAINGNKTIIGSIAINVLAIIQIPEPYKSISISVVSILTGAALKSHIDKGFFKQNKGQ